MKANDAFRKFLLIWVGQFVASIGSGLTAFALSVYVFRITNSASAVSLTILLAFLPTILLNPLGGVLADRFDRRLMMICGDLFSAFGLLYMLIYYCKESLGLFQIYIGVTISGIFVALLDPAYKATVSDLLNKDDYARASGMMQLAASAKYLLSPFIGGLLMTVTDIGTVLIIDISTLALTIAIVACIRKRIASGIRQRTRIQLFKDLKEGWKAVACDRGVLALVALISVATYYLGLLQTLISPMVLSFSDSKVLGMIESVSAIGMLLGSAVIGILPVKRYVRALAGGFCIAGISIAFFGISTSIIIITAAGVLFFCTLPYINTSADVMIRCKISAELQGRAWGLISILSQLGYVLAYASSGLLADKIFNPLLLEGGWLAGTIGKLIGVGPGRGIGFMFILSGLSVIILGLVIWRSKTIKSMEHVAKTG